MREYTGKTTNGHTWKSLSKTLTLAPVNPPFSSLLPPQLKKSPQLQKTPPLWKDPLQLKWARRLLSFSSPVTSSFYQKEYSQAPLASFSPPSPTEDGHLSFWINSYICPSQAQTACYLPQLPSQLQNILSPKALCSFSFTLSSRSLFFFSLLSLDNSL